MGHACMMADSQLGNPSRFTSPLSILQCPAGSREWRWLSTSVVCGQRVDCLHNVGISAALPDGQIVVAGDFYLCSLTSWIKNPFYKSSLSTVIIYMTSTPNTIASSTLLSNTGELQSYAFRWQGEQQQLKRWKGRLLHVLMMCPCFRSSGESLLQDNRNPFWVSDMIRYANRSAYFISAYGEGLSSAQAGWANRKYHSHHILPPEMVAEIKKSIPT